MHTAHVGFYKRYIKLLERELRAKDSNFISSIVIQPREVLPICCDLPMWAVLCKNTEDKIYVIGIDGYNKYLQIITDSIKDNRSMDIAVLVDPETDVKCFLFFN